MKIAIFTGTFDPVHEGHAAFVQAADRQIGFDEISVIAETKPRGKQTVTALSHRATMLQLAFADNPNYHVVNITTDYARMPDTLDELKLGDAHVYLLLGTDVALTLKTWSNIDELIKRVIFVVGTRSDADATRIHTLMAHLGVGIGGYMMIYTDHTKYSSSQVRTGTLAFHPKIINYIRKHHLYTL